MSDTGKPGNRRPPRGGADKKPFRKPQGAAGGGERRYGQPAAAGGSGEKRYGKPASGNGSGSGSGERRYGKPASGSGGAGGERRYGKPAPAGGNGEKRYRKPATGNGSGSSERRFAKPAPAGGNGEKRYGKPASGNGSGSGERRFAKPALAGGNGEKRYGKPASGNGSGGSEHRYGKPISATGNGEKRFAKPASGNGHGSSEHRYGKPISATGSGEKRYGKPASGNGSSERRFAKPASPAAGAERRYARPSTSQGTGERKFVRSAPAAGARRFAKPAFTPRSARPVPAKPAVPTEQTGLNQGARRVALDTLRDVHERGAYASLALQDRLNRSHLSPADRRLATSIVYATLEQQLQIDFALDRLMEHPTREPAQRDILRLSACQILFHDRVPDSAAVNEGVELARALGMEGAAGFLNAVLRNLVRGKDDIPWPKKEDDLREYLHIMGSMPLWLVDKLIAAYGEETAEAIVMHRGESHEIVARPNLMKFTDAAFEALLAGKAWRWRRGVAPHAYLLGGVSELAMDNDYRGGNFSVQGQSSILAAEAVQAQPGMRVLDACAAPGGKACYMAETMQGTGRVYAWELHEKRALLLESAKRRLHLDNLRITVRDAAEPKPDFDGMMDAVLLDAPCTGLGVLTEKPDLKYRLKPEDVPAIVETQKKLLSALCRYVKPGGTLVYSTCSILPEENWEQVRAFLSEHPEFTLQPLPLSYPEALRSLQTADGLQLFAHKDGVEGFYIARLRRARA